MKPGGWDASPQPPRTRAQLACSVSLWRPASLQKGPDTQWSQDRAQVTSQPSPAFGTRPSLHVFPAEAPTSGRQEQPPPGDRANRWPAELICGIKSLVIYTPDSGGLSVMQQAGAGTGRGVPPPRPPRTLPSGSLLGPRGFGEGGALTGTAVATVSHAATCPHRPIGGVEPLPPPSSSPQILL